MAAALATIAVTADTRGGSSAVDRSVCETDPAIGQRLFANGSSVTAQIDARAAPTFAVFVTANAPIPFDLANTRIIVRFKDVGVVTRGRTSVAVRTR